MANSPKPFPCKVLGCTFSFTTEDHLATHTRRHELNKLELPCSKAALFSDKTPTPTRTVDRLLKNCDAVGLFEDLQNVNPFEETFRQAVENKISINLCSDDSMKILAEVATAEDLNTPNCFPIIHKTGDKTSQEASAAKQSASSTAHHSNKTLHKVTPKKFPKILPKPQKNPINLTKDKLKAFLLKEPLTFELEARTRVKPSPKLFSSVDNNSSRGASVQRTIQNREAAKRYRKNQKARNNKILEENEALKHENQSLKMENKELKRMLAHIKARLRVKCSEASKETAKPVCILLPVEIPTKPSQNDQK